MVERTLIDGGFLTPALAFGEAVQSPTLPAARELVATDAAPANTNPEPVDAASGASVSAGVGELVTVKEQAANTDGWDKNNTKVGLVGVKDLAYALEKAEKKTAFSKKKFRNPFETWSACVEPTAYFTVL